MSDSRAFAYCYPNPALRTPRVSVVELWHHMTSFNHDLVIATIRGLNNNDTTLWDSGLPIHFRYGRAPAEVVDFYGYIIGPVRSWKISARTPVSERVCTVIAQGASYPLMDAYQGVFTNVSGDQIATKIAAGNYLNIDTVSHPYVWPHRYFGATTEWKALCCLARDIGYTCYVNKTELRFYDPLTALRRGNTTVPSFQEKDANALASVLSFEVADAEVSAAATMRKRTRVMSSTDKAGSPTYLSDDGSSQAPFLASRRLPPIFTEYVADLVANSQVDLNFLLPPESVANRFHIRASAQVAGNPLVTQESPVVIEGLGARDSGIWHVLSAVGHYSWNKYVLDLDLGRDSDFDSGLRPGVPSGIARAQYDPSQKIVFDRPPTVLRNNRWRSSYVGVAAA